MEKKMSIIEHLLMNRCRNILMSSLENGDHKITINFILNEKEYKDFLQNAYNNHNYLLNEYKEKIKLTPDEYIILKNIDKKYQWIARDKNNKIWLYEENPFKDDDGWSAMESSYFDVFNHLFQFIKFEDEEPYNIQELLENCEVV